MKKILLTGAAGFIGSHLAERLVGQEHIVRAFVRYNSKNHWGWLEELPMKGDMEVIAGDIRDYDSVWRAMKGCDTVFHLAALIGIPYSYISPLAYIRTNIEGTYNLLESARVLGLENVIVTSTSETYGTAKYVPIDENHPLLGKSPYSASKIGADQLALSYYLSFKTPMKIVRPFNTYGPRQSARAVIPTVITQILSGAPVRLGNLAPTRDFTFVRDTADGFIAIANCPDLEGQVTNIGMNHEISIGDLAGLISRIVGRPAKIVTEEERVRPETSEVERLKCDNRKILSFTAWRPRYDLEKGLTETIDWMKKHRELYKPEIYNV
ncbi:MAG: GDP-mannose 4,6-dehydratase [Acidobacteria bacterium]|nr:GDP-mannose 4,6-dehydratase [Acidobacteriota bacterium]